jgi:allophanate hydrolase subunit 2
MDALVSLLQVDGAHVINRKGNIVGVAQQIIVPIAASQRAARSVRWLAPALTVSTTDPALARAVDGVHAALFTDAARTAFFGERWRVAPDSNRMGYRLLGPKLELVAPTEILSQATCLGTVQVPANGQPIVLMADHQTTGGYPKIAEVIAADAPAVAQVPPGGAVRFVAVRFDEAAHAAFYAERWRIAPDSNRMGFRLIGPRLELAAPTEILSQATCLGTVQVPPAGQPIVLMADHQTTGGYPKIAEAIAADAPMLAQLAPGASLRFASATLAEADAAREALCARVDTLVQRILWEFGDESD